MKVSIIIPVYNAENFIQNCIDSVLAQTEKDWEAIFVNDGSTDKSEDIISAVNDKRIRLITQDNAGPSAARNRGIREAKGEYVFFLDADDTITPNCIELLGNLALENDSDYVQGTYYNEYQPADTFVLNNKKKIKKLLLNYNKIPYMPHNRMIRKSMIIEHCLFFDERIRVREDFLWMTFVAKHVNKFAYCHIPTYRREYNEGSLTNNVNTEREIVGYKVLIEEMCNNLDPFLLRNQKTLVLDALIMAIKARYIEIDSKEVKKVKSVNNFIQRFILNIYLRNINKKFGKFIINLLKRTYIIW